MFASIAFHNLTKGETFMKNTFRFFLLVLLVSAKTNPLLAQWVQTNGPYKLLLIVLPSVAQISLPGL